MTFPRNENVNDGNISVVSDLVNLPYDTNVNPSLASIDQIIDEVGEGAVEPIYFAWATNFTPEMDIKQQARKTGHIKARHHVDTMLRPGARGLGWKNSIPTIIIDAIHDNSEDYGGGTFPGTVALSRHSGLVFGKDFEVASNQMTNYNSMVLKYVRENGLKVNSKAPVNITQQDILNDIDSVRKDLAARCPTRQRNALEAILSNMENFRAYLKNQDLPRVDKERIRRYLNKWKRKAMDLKQNPIPYKEIIEFSNCRIDSLIELLTPEFPENTIRLYFDERSYVFHTAREIGYRGYIRKDIVEFKPEDHGVKMFTKQDLIDSKEGDREDNIRLTGGTKSKRAMASEYLKTEIVIDEIEKYCINNELHNRDISMRLDSLRSQLVLRILTDNYQIMGESDQAIKDLKTVWLPEQFAYVYTKLGHEFMEGIRTALKRNPHAIATDHKTAEVLLYTYDRLMDDEVMKGVKPPGYLKRLGERATEALGKKQQV